MDIHGIEIPTLSVQQLADKLKQNDDIFLLDVREPHELTLCMIEGAVHIPMNMIPLNMDQIPDGKDIVIYCHHGVRSLAVVNYLVDAGFDIEHIYNLDGGINSWAKDVDPTMNRY